MPGGSKADEAASLLKSPGNQQRLRILCPLAAGDQSVRAINATMDPSQSALAQRLARLRADRMVTTRGEAQTI